MSTEILNQGWRKARKKHICDWCGEAIEKGEEYHCQTCVDNTSREIWTIKNHAECEGAFNETLADYPGEEDQICEEILSCAGRKRGKKFEG